MEEQAEQDLGVFAALSAEVQASYAASGADPWEASPFLWIAKTRSSRRRGAIGEALVRAWAEHEGFHVQPAVNSGHDCRINDLKVEIKLSTLWESGVFKFQQFRDQDYEIGLLLGIEPQRVSLWVVPKEDLWSSQIPFQHGGQKGRDTKWLSFRPETPPDWLRQHGGRLLDARAALEQAQRRLRS